MSLGQTIGLAQALADYRAMNGSLIGQAFDDMLEVTASNSNVLSDLIGGEDSGKPFVEKRDLTKGAKDRVNYPVATTLGQAPRQGTDQLVGYEEALLQNSWQVRIDSKRIAVGWNEITAQMASTGKSWREVYAELLGTRIGQITQEDLLQRMLRRSQPTSMAGGGLAGGGSANITLYPNGRSTINELRTADTFDVDTLKRAAAKLKSMGTPGATTGKTRSGRPIQKYIAFGADAFVRGIKDETAYLSAATAQITAEGDRGALFTGDYLPVDGHLIKPWDVVDHDNPGPIGSAILPKALLGDPITTGTGTFHVYGGGRTQASLGDQAPIYNPFEAFPGYQYKFYSEDAPAADGTNTFYFVAYDPADGKWNVYSYLGSTGNTGNNILIVNRLSAGTTGAQVQNLAGVAFDSSVNKEAFPTGSILFPVNNACVPYGYGLVWGRSAGGIAYGTIKNKRISNVQDYGSRVGFGIQSIYGCDVRLDTLGQPRGYVVVAAAVQHEGVNLPSVS
jgi:hypothetical protein